MSDEPEAVVDATTAADGVLLEGAQARQRLAGVQDLGGGPLQRGDPVGGGRRDAGQVAREVERGALGGEHRPGRSGDGHDPAARLHAGAVRDPLGDGEIGAAGQVEGQDGDAEAGDDAPLRVR